MAISIEKAVPSDAALILDYLKQVGGETDNLTFGAEGLPFSVESEVEFISGMENSCDDIMLVAKDGSKIVGNASLTRLPRRMGHRGDFAVSVAKECVILILSILVYTFFSRMFDLMLPPVAKHSIAVA